MALVRWNPWGELDQLFQSLSTETAPGNRDEYTTLPVDIKQTDSEYIIEASVPGFRPEDVEVTFEDGVLTIRGTRKEESEDKTGRYVRRERRVASVFRQMGLPAEVRADEISAAFDNGVLRVTVPRAQKAQPKRIEVKSSNSSKQEHKVLEHQQR
jgi:HSP20 family protein